MKQVPFAAPAEFEAGLKPEGEKEELWCLVAGGRVLLRGAELPERAPLPVERPLYLGVYRDKHLFAAETKGEAPAGFCFEELRGLYGRVSEDLFALVGRAVQLIDWERSHQHCGCCGAKRIHRAHERCLECPSCGHLAYPNVAPAVMALVRRGSPILLARGPHFPEKMYSVLAGFVDAGETLEQCVMREAFEEVGLRVKNVRYFGSQPWPISRSLMIGFVCDWESGEIQKDDGEIEDAGWFEKGELPLIPTDLSLARLLIDSVIQ